MNNNQTIPVPIGGGLDARSHDWLLQPPKAAEAQNFDLRADGAYRKRSGFNFVATLADSASALLPQRNAFAVMSASGFYALHGEDFTRQDFGAAIPTAVTTRRVLSFRGAVSGAQVARNGNHVALALTEADAETGRRAVLVVLELTTWTITDGPYYLSELAHGVRVEPIGTDSFLFLGVDISSDVRTEAKITGTLYGAVVTPGGAEPSPVLLSAIEAYDNVALNLLYDSHGIAGQDYVYVAFINAETQWVGKVDASAVMTKSSVHEAFSGGNLAVWYDSDKNTVLVYNEDTQLLHYSDGSFTSGWTSAGTVDIAGSLPMFHQRATSGVPLLWLNDRRVTLLGTNPATPTVAGADTLSPTLHRRPQPQASDGAYFFHRYQHDETENYGDRLIAGGEMLSADEWAPLPTGSTSRMERMVTLLGQGRSDLWYMDHFHAYYWYDSTGPTTERAVYGVNGQSAKNGTVVYSPQLVANSAYLPPPLQRAYAVRNRIPVLLSTPNNSSLSGSVIASADQANFGREIESDGADGWLSTNDIAHRTGGAGINEGVLQLVVNEIETDSVRASVVELFGSLVVAAGGLSVFDGSVSVPATLEPPSLVDLVTDDTQDGVFPNSSSTTSTTVASESFRIDDGQSVSFRGVLFTIDRNGVKYRSDSFTMGYIENSQGRTVDYYPKWSLDLTPAHRSMLFAGRKLGVEIYVSEEYAVADPPADEPTSHTFLMRTAVQYDPIDDTFFVSGATLWNADSDREPTLPFSVQTFNPTSLYTETELGPQTPPASNVMVHAGNYLFLLSSEDDSLVWHSKPISEAIGPEFHSDLTVRMPPESGGCVSMAGESDRILFLCRNGVYELFVAGAGPDAEGSGVFPPLRKVYGGDGCLTHACTVTGPFGAFFVTQSGPKLLGDNGLVDIGKQLGVDPTTFEHATFNPVTKEIWLSRGDDGYILDTTRMEWVYTSLAADASTVWNGTFYRTADGMLLQANADAVQDGGRSYQAKYVSPWLTLVGHMGYARVRKVGVLIQPLQTGSGRIRVSLAYDYIDTDIDTFTYDFSAAEGLDKPMQLEVRPTRQKLDSLRITVEDISEA